MVSSSHHFAYSLLLIHGFEHSAGQSSLESRLQAEGGTAVPLSRVYTKQHLMFTHGRQRFERSLPRQRGRPPGQTRVDGSILWTRSWQLQSPGHDLLRAHLILEESR